MDSPLIGTIVGVDRLAALVCGVVGVVRCRAWKTHSNDGVAADLLMLIKAFPAGFVLVMAMIAGLVWLGVDFGD